MKTLIRLLFPTAAAAIRDEGYRDAMNDILVMKDKLYTEPVTLIGDHQTLTNSVFFAGVKIQTSGKAE
jgi:hypothetical protein